MTLEDVGWLVRKGIGLRGGERRNHWSSKRSRRSVGRSFVSLVGRRRRGPIKMEVEVKAVAMKVATPTTVTTPKMEAMVMVMEMAAIKLRAMDVKTVVLCGRLCWQGRFLGRGFVMALGESRGLRVR
jgi:hypothetical protein